ncbi:MAG: alpha/beta hydrolase [Nanoarchaeota archaeon]|nr:alpha/beta hydrolase [Nanoarchaeota archaeon]
MIIIIYLLSIEDKVKAQKNRPASFTRQKRVIGEDGNVKYVDFRPDTRADYEQKTTPESEYKRQVGPETEHASQAAGEKYRTSLSQRIKTAVGNVKNMANNAVDVVIGKPITKVYNWQTEKFVKKNPDTKHEIWYNEHGSAQGKHNQWRLMRQGRQMGKLMYGLDVDQSKGPQYSTDQSFDQIYKFQEKTGLKNPEKRNDKYVGHSSGGNTGLYMATDPRIKKAGIKEIHAVAATPHGVAMDTIERKLMGALVNIDYDRKDKAKGQQASAELYKRGKPFVDVYMSGGSKDGLVRPEDINYKHAKGFKIIDHKDATHFGTSGSNETMNQIILNMMANPNKNYNPMINYEKQHKEKKAA